MNSILVKVFAEKPDMPSSVKEELMERAKEYRIIFAEYSSMTGDVIQVQCAKTADPVIQNQLMLKNGSLVIE